MKKLLGMLLVATTVAIGSTLPAHAETAGQYGVPRTGRICIEDNGWSLYNDALPELAARMRAQGVANVVVWDECNGPGGQLNVYHTTDRVIDIITANSPNENYCGRVERTWKWVNSKWVVASTNIRVNLGIPSCYNNAFARRHGMSHEVMHSFGSVHEGRDDRVVDHQGGWNYAWPTNQDYRELRYAGYTDLS